MNESKQKCQKGRIVKGEVENKEHNTEMMSLTFSRITPVSDDVSRLMNVESVLLRGRLGFESGEIQRDFQFITHFLDELHGALKKGRKVKI